MKSTVNAEIENVRPPQESELNSFPFPAIDFKFVNRGDGAAFIRKVTVMLRNAEVDITPFLEFEAFERNGALCLRIRDRGWGSVCKCDLTLSESMLDKIFPRKHLRFCSVVVNEQESEDTHFTLNPPFGRRALNAIRARVAEAQASFASFPRQHLSAEDTDVVRHLLKKFAPSSQGEVLSDFRDYVPSFHDIAIGEMRLQGHCWDDAGRRHIVDATVRTNRETSIYLSESGFSTLTVPPDVAKLRDSEAAFCVLFDPSEAPTERTYSMSVEIPAGGTERFHIVVGASKSCHLTAQFVFHVDVSTVVCSQPFDLSIWRPRGRLWTVIVQDGAEFRNRNGRWVLSTRSCFERYECNERMIKRFQGGLFRNF